VRTKGGYPLLSFLGGWPPEVLRGFVKILAGLIKRRLQADTGKHGHCAIYEEELQRLWPLNTENRRAKIEQFAKQYGLRLAYYKQGLCAIFVRNRNNHASL
jgi:hypothetical protein